MRTLYLCGAGNPEGVRLARRCNERARQWDQILLLDDDEQKHGQTILGVTIAGPIDLLAAAAPGSAAVNLVARTTAGRDGVHRRMLGFGVPMPTLVHPGVDAADCCLGDGALVYEQAILSPLTAVGDGTVVFMRALVGHDATVGAGCVIAAGAVLNARVRLDDGVYVGSNASILPDVHVGAGATIGANSLVVTDVPAGATIVGVPGQVVTRPPAAPASKPGIGDETGSQLGASPAAAPLEAQLMELLHGVLNHRDAAATDHFFEVGGSSLRAIQLVEAIRGTLGHEIPLTVFYSCCSMRELAEHLAGSAPPNAGRNSHDRGLARRRRLTARDPGRATGPLQLAPEGSADFANLFVRPLAEPGQEPGQD